MAFFINVVAFSFALSLSKFQISFFFFQNARLFLASNDGTSNIGFSDVTKPFGKVLHYWFAVRRLVSVKAFIDASSRE